MAFFYVIQHQTSGKLYAGVSGTDHNLFMTEAGYQTSSATVHRMVKEGGLECFEIVRIREFGSFDEAYSYETRFLTKVDAAKNPAFLNKHNNHGMVFGIPEFYEASKATFLKKYGFEYISQSPEIKEVVSAALKAKASRPICQEIRDKLFQIRVKCPRNLHLSPDKILEEALANFDQFAEYCRLTCGEQPLELTKETRESNKNNGSLKRRLTTFERYGVEHYPQSKEGREKMRESGIRSQQGESAEKRKATNLERYGVDSTIKAPEVRDKMKSTTKERYGVEFFSQHPDFIRKREEGNLKRLGVRHHQETDEWRQKHTDRLNKSSSRPLVKTIKDRLLSEGKRIPPGLHMYKDSRLEELWSSINANDI